LLAEQRVPTQGRPFAVADVLCDLSCRLLVCLPLNNAGDLKNLVHLDLRGNMLQSFPKGFSSLKLLTHLLLGESGAELHQVIGRFK
jgi:hypothetical protein